MKVLYLAESLDQKTGWGRFSHEIITRCGEKGVEVTILVERASGLPGEVPLLKRSFGALTVVPEVRRRLREGAFDVVHSLELNPYAITAHVANICLRIPHVISATGAYSVRPLYQAMTRHIARETYKKARAVLCISTYVEQEIQKAVHLTNTKVVTLGVDFKSFSGNRRKPKHPFLLSVGNLSYRKGYHISVAAFARIARDFPGYRYVIAGKVDTNMHRVCQEIIQSHNLKDKVVFLGQQNDGQLKELYLSADAFVLTSVNADYHFEGFGLVFLEAAAAGLPVIGTLGNGIGDAVSEGMNGFLVPQYDVEETAAAMSTILKDVALKERFSKNSILWAQKNSWDKTIEAYLATYRALA